MLAQGVRWFDDWFAIEPIANGIVAIGEPRFHQINWSYLVLGQRRALLFDTGPGVRDMAKVVRALTTLPVTALPSHMHFDHTGGLAAFRDIAIADLPLLRGCETDGWLNPAEDLYLGSWEGMSWTPVRVGEWLPIGAAIDLGGRTLRLLHTPGHSPDSVSLLDAGANILLAADFVYPGELYAQVRNADLASYLDSATALAPVIDDATLVLCAHGSPDEDRLHRAPRLARADIASLATSLGALRASGQTPSRWPVNDRMSLLLSADAFASWQSRA